MAALPGLQALPLLHPDLRLLLLLLRLLLLLLRLGLLPPSREG